MTKKELLERLSSYGDDEEVKIVDIKDQNNFEEIPVDEFLKDFDEKEEFHPVAAMLLEAANTVFQERLEVLEEEYEEFLKQMEDIEKILSKKKETEQIRLFNKNIKTVRNLLSILDN